MKMTVKAMAAGLAMLLVTSGGWSAVLLLTSYAPAEAGYLTGKDRNDFIGTGMVTCVRDVKASPVTQAAGVSDARIRQYCECTLNNLADSLTFEELTSVLGNRDVPSSVQQKEYEAIADCAATLRS